MSAFGPDRLLEFNDEISGLGVMSCVCAIDDTEFKKARLSARMKGVLAEHRELEILRRGMIHNINTYIETSAYERQRKVRGWRVRSRCLQSETLYKEMTEPAQRKTS